MSKTTLFDCKIKLIVDDLLKQLDCKTKSH